MIQLRPTEISDWVNPKYINLGKYSIEKLNLIILIYCMIYIIYIIPNLSNKKIQTPLSKLKTLFIFRVTIKKIIFSKLCIQLNRDLRREAEKEGNKIKKQNAKLRNNVIFGKSI